MTVSKIIQQVSVALVAGYSHQFRVQPENDQFYGEVSDPSQSLTVPCPGGDFIKPNGGCSSCGVGTYSLGNAIATACIACPRNEISSGGASICMECGPNKIANDAKSACIPCKSCAVGEGVVAACSDGVDTECARCKDGEFSSGGTSTCESCKTNEISNTAKSACIPCKQCAAGQGVISFCHGSADTRCNPCGAGMFSPGGWSLCEWCSAGQFCPMGAFAPRRCLKGHFCKSISTDNRTVWGSSEVPCPLGTYCPTSTVSPLPCAVGATCTVPASPELVISNNGVLEKRESEASGFLYYNISLSVKPSEYVNVTVKKEELGQVDCVQYKDGLILNKTTYVFNPSNWSVPQKVEIDVFRNKTFQGTSVTNFKHEISSEDPAWQSPFLRPMTISITDDDECTNGAQKEDEFIEAANGQRFTIRTCVCTKGHFIEATDASYCNSVTRCVPCTEGMICTGKETLDRILLAPGKYRMGLHSPIVVDCPVFKACTGTLSNLPNATAYVSSSSNSREIEFALRERLLNNSASSSGDLRNWGALLCRVGHQGAFCQVCTVAPNATYYWSDDTCQKCEGEKGNATIVFAVAGAGSFLLAMLQLSGLMGKMKGRVLKTNTLKWLESTCSRLKLRIGKSNLQTKCEFFYLNMPPPPPNPLPHMLISPLSPSTTLLDKILVTFVQVLNKVITLYPFELPTVFTSTWSWINERNPFVLDLNVLPFNCIVETNFHSRLIMVTVAPMICLALAYMYYRLRLAFMQKTQNDEKDDWKALCIRIAILFVLTIFPPVSTTIFQTFNYDERLGDGSAYLKADYNIEYKDEQHQNFRIYALAMGLLYCMGIPLCSFLLLFSKKDKIQELQVLEYSRVIVDDLIADKTRTASGRKRSAFNSFKDEGRDDVIMEEVTSGDITGSLAPESEAMRPKEDLPNAVFTFRDELAGGSDFDDTIDLVDDSFCSPDSEAMTTPNAMSNTPQLPLRMQHLEDTGEPEAACLDRSIRNIALQRLANRENQLLRGDPVLKGLSPLYSGIHINKYFRTAEKYDNILIFSFLKIMKLKRGGGKLLPLL
jgi:hypothetical protein